MKQITVYTTTPCARCPQAKAILASHGLKFDEVNLAKDADGRTELARRTGLMTFPQIVIEDQTVGGLEDLRIALADGTLDELLAA